MLQFDGNTEFYMFQFHGNTEFDLFQFDGNTEFDMFQFDGNTEFDMFQFDGNTEFDIIYHPVYGPSACIMAKQEIQKGEELYVNYNYRVKWAPDWYKKAYKEFKKRTANEAENRDEQE
jgi:hypothetical protein